MIAVFRKQENLSRHRVHQYLDTIDRLEQLGVRKRTLRKLREQLMKGLTRGTIGDVVAVQLTDREYGALGHIHRETVQ